MKKLVLSFLLVLFFALLLTPRVLAQSVNVEVSGNGESSQNQSNVSVSQNQTITQNNQAQVSNNVSTDQNTGNNQANSNTGGETSIETGNTQTSLDISNSVNTNVAQLDGCCQGNINTQISGNGSDSQNSVNLSVSSETNIWVENNAFIQNFVNVNANTGRNEASNNLGHVSISTGGIDLDGSIRNRGNISVVVIDPNSGDIHIVNKANGSNSVNSINVEIENVFNFERVSNAEILNYVEIEANTGENIANGNLGGVDIQTGDISINFAIINDPINFDAIIIGELPKVGGPAPQEEIIVQAPPPEQPEQPSEGEEEEKEEGAPAPQAPVSLAQLPVTGPQGLLLWAIFWFLTLVLGTSLRLFGREKFILLSTRPFLPYFGRPRSSI